MMDEDIYIDTRPWSQGLFCPPAEVDDYTAWLNARYKACQYKDGQHTAYRGVAQRMNQIVVAMRNGVTVHAFGPYAGALAKLLEQQAETGAEVEVLARAIVDHE